jgi:2-amino-4-hydroxy-6-hydroxymethyldihydropteridine diphosphokinase
MIKKPLNNKLSLIKTACFPTKFKGSKKRYTVTLGVGGNITDVIRRFERLVYFLKKDKNCDILQTGTILKNPPFAYENQDDFHNSVILVKTNLRPMAFLRYILEVERKFGRKRSFANAPRTLDIDIIFYENIKMNTKKLTIPHPCYKDRESVLIPLMLMDKR